MVFVYNDLENIVEDLLADPHLDGHLNFHHKTRYGQDSHGQTSRILGPFECSEYMRYATASCADDEHPVLIAVFSDGVAVKKNGEGHPLFLTLMNIDGSTRLTQRAMRLLGIIPTLGEGSSYSADEAQMRRLEIVHHSITYAFTGFNELHETAKLRTFPDGKQRKTRLFLCVWPGDMKEHWTLTLIKNRNCHMCVCPKNEFGTVGTVYKKWSPVDEERRYEGQFLQKIN